KRLPENAAEVLNRFIIDICVPATILRLVPSLKLRPELAVLVAVPWAMAAIAYLCSRVARRALELDASQTTALFLATALGNTSFLGFPLCSALLGESSLPLAVVYDQLGSFLLLSIVAPLALAKVSAGSRATPGQLARRVLLFPPFVALLLAILPLPWPPALQPVLSAAAAPLVPLAIFAVGLKLSFSPPRPARAFALGLGLKLLLFPCIGWLLARALGAQGLVLKVAVLESAMPTMITAGAMLMAYDVASDLAAAFVSWGLILSLLSVPAWSVVLR
ncbi:MAG TPA: AEC family transporter, partial [Polyangiaceae bacterium]|nr:AEC family transporter [Polyangiaceae bacterium]